MIAEVIIGVIAAYLIIRYWPILLATVLAPVVMAVEILKPFLEILKFLAALALVPVLVIMNNIAAENKHDMRTIFYIILELEEGDRVFWTGYMTGFTDDFDPRFFNTEAEARVVFDEIGAEDLEYDFFGDRKISVWLESRKADTYGHLIGSFSPVDHKTITYNTEE